MLPNLQVDFVISFSTSNRFMSPLAGWQKCLLHLVEDQGTVLTPLFLQNNHPQKTFLQDMIDEWHISDPYIYICLFPSQYSAVHAS